MSENVKGQAPLETQGEDTDSKINHGQTSPVADRSHVKPKEPLTEKTTKVYRQEGIEGRAEA